MYLEKNLKFSRKTIFFDEKYFSEKNNVDENLRFHHWDFDENHEISDLGIEKIFLGKYFSSKKKSFSTNFLVFLQQHTLGSYLTQYDHPTPKTREVRSLEKNCFTFFNLRLDILDDLRSDNDMYM